MTVVSISMKHNDMVDFSIDNFEIGGYMPYVNSCLGGDYTNLRIDNDTGTIIGWTPVKFTEDNLLDRNGTKLDHRGYEVE